MKALGALGVAAALLLTAAPAALAHEERDSFFPPGTGTAPTYRPFSEDRPHLVVCKPGSRRAAEAMTDPRLRAFNLALVERCRFEHIQAAVDAVTVRGTNIYVLPGTYREEPSWDPECGKDYDGGIVDYPLTASCGAVVNLVTVAGDGTPDTVKTDCNELCDLQIEGTGQRMEDVVLQGGFRNDWRPGDGPDDSWVKHNGLKADRADGFYLRNMTAELFRENAFYVHETDGYVIERVNARHNDLYGILTFTSDHGIIRDCDASYNGDSGLYPGSAADVNAATRPPGRSPATPSRSPAAARTTTRWASPARPATRSTSTTTTSTTTRPATSPTRSSAATRACRRTTPGSRTTGSSATTTTT
jgi:hypothetical protein